MLRHTSQGRRLLAPPLFRMFRRLLLVFSLLAAPLGLLGQNPSADLIRQGNLLFDQAKYPDAAAVYERLLNSYPNAESARDAQIHLAYSRFFSGQFQPAIDQLRKILGNPATPPELQELSSSLLPQVLSQQAGALPPADARRKPGYESAIAEFGAFMQKFPKSPEVETALYGRAVAAYQIGSFADAERDLRQSIATFPRSDNADDTAFLLALTIGSQANILLAKSAAAAIKSYEEARALLAGVINKRADPALVNDAQYQLGATLLAQAAASPPGAKPALLAQALASYRAVQPREPMIAAQTARIARLRDQRLAEARKGPAADKALLRQLESRISREQGKLASLQGKEDSVLTARLQCAAVFYQQNRYDETRVLMNTLAPVATRPDDEKSVLCFIALSYAGQNNTAKAVAAYDKFQAKYAGDPIAENLPLVMGAMFMGGAAPDASRANRYFAEFTKYYPNSNLRDVAMLQQASTSASLKRYDEALQTIDGFLGTSPKRELVAAAELTRAGVLKDKGDFPGALAAYRKVRDTFADRPEAEDAAFFVGWVDLQNHDAPGALAELKTFLAKHPDSRLAASALLTQSQAQLASNAKEAALASLAQVIAKFAKSPEAASAYFQRANIYIADKKFDDVVKTLTEFVDKYPDDPQALAACDRIAAIQLQGNQPALAAGTYQKFIDRQPAAPTAPEALGKIAALWLRAARQMGAYIVLGASQRDAWTKDLSASIAASEKQLDVYPDAPATALGLQTLLDCQRLLIDARLKTFDQVREYFDALALKNSDRPAARSRIVFRVASLTLEKNPAAALSDMQSAYDPSVVYSPADLDQYSGLLLGDHPDAAEAVFQKLANDYPVPPGVSPAQAPPEVQDAQAIVLYGAGAVAEKKGDLAAAAAAYETLKKTYPRSSKTPQANLGIAQSLVKQGKPDQAMPLLAEVAKSPAAPLETRAGGMMLLAKIQQAKGQIGALDTYLKLQAFYPASSQAAEALWLGAQLLEKQAAGLPDTASAPNAPTKASQTKRAREAYNTIVTKYPDSPFAAQAKAKLSSAVSL